MYDYLIVGSGLFGAVFAHEAAKAGKSCLVIDKRQHTGGNLHCQLIDNIWVHQYGAHIFHTSNRQVWQYVNQLTEFNNFVNSPLASYQGKLYHLPFNMNTFYELWGVRTPAEARAKIDEQRSEFAHITQPANLEEQALTLCGRDIYERLIKGYTEKQWGCAATQLPAFIIKRLPFRFTFDNNYFNDRYQGIPEGGGYNALIDALLARPMYAWAPTILPTVTNSMRRPAAHSTLAASTSFTTTAMATSTTAVCVLSTNGSTHPTFRVMPKLHRAASALHPCH